MYKASELREKSREELLQLVSELKGKLLALRFEAATGQLQEVHLPKATKKDIALVFTVLKEKEKGIVIESKAAAKPAAAKVEEATPVVEATPAIEEATPVVEEVATPVVEETTPVVEEATQAVEEAAPVAEEATQAVEEAPVADEEAAPAENNEGEAN